MISRALVEAWRQRAGERPCRVAATLALALLAGGVVVGCGGDVDARLEVTPTRFELPHGGWVPVRFTVTPLRALAVAGGPPYLFVHLLGKDGLVRTFDQPLRGRWQPGTALVQEVRVYQSLVGPALPAGEYTLTAGIYPLQGERLRLDTDGGRRGKLEYEVAEVTVPARSRTPRVRFSESFLPVEVGRDQQVLARRYSNGEALIMMLDVPAAGTLWLTVQVPSAVAGESEVQLGEGKDQPGVQVETSCADTRAALAGAGVHAVDLPMASGRAECDIRLVPDFRLVETDGGRTLGPALEILAWAPAAVASGGAGDAGTAAVGTGAVGAGHE